MHSNILRSVFLAVSAATALAFVPAELTNRDATTTCKSPYGSGTCANTASNCAGVYLPGYCPGATNIQCCITTPIACQTPDGDGLCGDTDRTCAGGQGFYSAGYCPGPNDVQCCVPTTPDPPPSDNDGDDGATVAQDPDVDSNIVDNAEVIADLIADGLDGEFDDDGNPINTTITTRDFGPLDARAAKKTKGQLIYAAAAKQLGIPYKWGGGNCAGKTKGGFDCSGLVLHAVCKVTKKSLPHQASAQYKSSKGRHIKYADRQQGDAIFWGCGSSKGVYHVGIVKDKTYFINAPHSNANVRVQKVWGSPCKSVVRFW